jgi:hypothetical protein
MPVPANPHVQIIVRGLFVSSIIQGTTPARIDLLRQLDAGSHPHKKAIKITKILSSGAQQAVRFTFDFSEDCTIEVTDPLMPGINCHAEASFTDRFNPLPANAQDFRWVVNLEREVTQGFLSAHLAQRELMPQITLNHGLFYTQERSTSEAVLVEADRLPNVLLVL